MVTYDSQQRQQMVPSSLNGNDLEVLSNGTSNEMHDGDNISSISKSRNNQNDSVEFRKQQRRARISRFLDRIENDQTEINIKESLLLAAGSSEK